MKIKGVLNILMIIEYSIEINYNFNDNDYIFFSFCF